MSFRSWEELVREPRTERHIVHLYREAGFLRDVLAEWAGAGLARGGAVVLVCTPANATLALDGLRGRLGAAGGGERKRLFFVDADCLMARFMVDGLPSPSRFRDAVRPVIEEARAASASGEVRAWGEMVNLLWHRGNPAAARALESLWNEVIDEESIRLLCSYRVDNLAPETHGGALDSICAGHSQLIPERDFAALEDAVSDALVETLGEDEAAHARASYASARTIRLGMPPAQAVLMAVHAADPEVGRRVLAGVRRRVVTR